MGTRVRAASARVDDISIDRVEVTNFGDSQRYYVQGDTTATGEVTLPDGTRLALTTRLTGEEQRTLNALLDRVGERVLRELTEGLS